MPFASLSMYNGLFGKPNELCLKGKIMFLSAKLMHLSPKEKNKTPEASLKVALFRDKTHSDTH